MLENTFSTGQHPLIARCLSILVSFPVQLRVIIFGILEIIDWGNSCVMSLRLSSK